MVWRVLRRAGLSAADVEDAAQDVFWVLAQRFADVPEPAQRSFLAATALRVAADRRRSRWNRSVTTDFDADAAPGTELAPDEAFERRRALALVDRALNGLDASDREVFILSELEQMTRSETAKALGIPEGTVATRLRRARTTLEGALARALARSRRPL